MSELRQEQCEYCDGGWCEGPPIATPDGPYYPSYRCTACSGDGWIIVEYRPVEEEDLWVEYGGVEDGEDPNWY